MVKHDLNCIVFVLGVILSRWVEFVSFIFYLEKIDL
jgi:hypothetical protein